MRELFLFVSDFDHAKVLALIISCLASLAVVGWILNNAQQTNIRMNNVQWAIVYGFGFISFMSGISVFGLMIAPRNVDSLLDTLRLTRFCNIYTKHVQDVLLWFIKLLL